jgi:hypothetical protein
MLLAATAVVASFLAGMLALAQAAAAQAPGSVSATELPLPSGAGGPANYRLSQYQLTCVSSSWCVEATYEETNSQFWAPLALVSSSGTWTADQLPLPSGGVLVHSAYASAVSCSGAGSCVLVGDYDDQHYNAYGLIETLSGGTWTAQSAPQPSGTGSYQSVELESVSCPSSTVCAAAGEYETSSGSEAPFVDTLSSGQWSATALSLPSGDTSANLVSISCATASSCATAGTAQTSSVPHGLVATWNGTTWSDQNASLPSGANSNGDGTLLSVNCWASGSCTAVGQYETSSGTSYPLVTTYSSSTWSGKTTGSVASSGQLELESVSCYSASWCAAVGYYDDSSGYEHGLVETYSGSSWSGATGSEPANAGTVAGADQSAVLYSVSCPAASSCVAAGYYEDSSSYEWGLLDTLSGSSQTPAAASEPSNAGTDAEGEQSASLHAVSCYSSTFCAAGGSYQVLLGLTYFGGLEEVLSSGSWSATQAAPSPSPPYDPLAIVEALSCPTASSCVAAGFYDDSDNGQQSFASSLSGGTWQTVTLPEPADAGNDADGEQTTSIDALSCSAPGSCVAVGSYKSTSAHIEGLIETLSSGAWTATTAPEPSNAASNPVTALSAVSCPAAGTCVAVGRYENSSDRLEPLIESLSAGTWSATAAPLPSNAGSGLNLYVTLTSVACPITSSCVAVGSYLDTSSTLWGLVETGSGTSWSGTSAPEPSNAAAGSTHVAVLDSLSCAAVGTCVAVGTYPDTSGHTDALVDSLSGGSWAPLEGPTPSQSGGTFAELFSVSCPAASTCVAVGEFEDTSGYYWGDIVSLSGGSWSAYEASEPSNAGSDGDDQEALMRFVSCPSVSWCVAAGSYEDTSAGNDVYLQTGAGSSWSLTQGPPPANATSPQYNGSPARALACDAAGECLVGGDYYDSGPTTEALVDSVTPPAPTVSAVSPSAGPGEGGATVSVTGTNFFPSSTVTFGGVGAGTVTYLSPTSLQVSSEPGSGTVDVQVSTDGGTSATTVADEFSFGPGSPSTLGVAAPAELYFDLDLTGYDQWASASESPLGSCGPGAGGEGTACAGGSAPVIEILDDTGSGDGWALSAYLTGSGSWPGGAQLDFDGAGSATTGDSTQASLASLPFSAESIDTVCDYESSCTPPVPASSCGHSFSSCPSDPVVVSVAGSASQQVDLYSAAAGSGKGDNCLAFGTPSGIDCAGTTPAAYFDLGLPASAPDGSYGSADIVLTISSGP